MLKDLAAREVELATEALANAMKVADEAVSRQNLLYDYRQGYVNNMNKTLETGMVAESYQNYQNFFGKLDQAIAGQQEVVEMTKVQVKLKRDLWQESQRKKLSYEVLLQRSDKQVLKAEQKKDQKVMDEFAMRMSRTGR
ncbi:MAG: flagellar export protein FliJ [Pseudomonadota bacterium]